jgi:ubiquinone/menaquinone biosynthesis C-methylase UbiE
MEPARSHVDGVNPLQHLHETADLHASSDAYAKRFSGPTGVWMLRVQEQAVEEFLPGQPCSVLDVGGGHGQIAIPLSRRGYPVTVLGSSAECAQQVKLYVDAGTVSFDVGNLVELPYSDLSFDVAVSFRLMSHCEAWPTLTAEMCRVARAKVIIDYPVWCSTNILTPVLFYIKRLIEGNTRNYRVFTTRELTREFSKHGFRLAALRKQFFFPMVIHRLIRSTVLSEALEKFAAVSGLTALLGSPIVAMFERSGHER